MAEPTPSEWLQALQGKFTAVSAPSWQDRRQRPGSRDDGAAWATFSRRTVGRAAWLDTLWSYNVGDPPLPQVAEEYRDLFRDVLRKARSNYAPMCLGATTDRMELQAVSTLDDFDADGDDVAAEIMEESGFSSQFKDCLDFMFSMSESYMMAVPGQGGAPPTAHAIDPRRCVGVADRRNPVRLQAALVKDYDDVTNEQIHYLFLPGRKYEYRQRSGSTLWEPRPYNDDAEFERIAGLDDLGGIPIVRFDNKNGLGEYEPHIDLLDRINDTTLQRIIGFWYQSLRQRAVGVDEDDDDDQYEGADDVEDGLKKPRPIDWDKITFEAGPGSLWKFPKDFAMWESQQTDFGPFINAKRDDVKEFAALTSTPLYLVTPDDANGSALGAGLQRESATSKVRDRRSRITPRLKLLWRMLFTMAGEAQRGQQIRLHWGPIEFLSLAEQASADGTAVSLSTEDKLERIWQMSPAEIKRCMQRRDAEQLMQASLAQAAQPTPQQQSQRAVSSDSADTAA